MEFIETDIQHFTDEQKIAFEKFKNGENLFITGPEARVNQCSFKK